ncbi:MAG: DoxX family protein [Candidatus Melainabacteria bacterium]|nr:DoxX family protein [Candidatus Melainabacteria bacterium]
MEKYSNLLALYARFFLCMSLFWHAGFNIAAWNLQVAVLTHLTQSFTAPILSATTAAEIVLGIAILIGYMTRHIACMAALYTLVNTLLMHSFWSSDPGTQVNDAMNFFQSIGLAGGFLLLAAFGPGEFSADAKLKEPARTTEPTSETKA